MSADGNYTGQCLCGGVTYEITGPLAPIQICHCADCKKAQGSAFAANIPVDRSAFTLHGDVLLRAYASPTRTGKARVFCSRCGSHLYSEITSDPDTIRIRAGTINEDITSGIDFHFFVDSKCKQKSCVFLAKVIKNSR